MKIHCFINFFASIHEADESVAIYFDLCLLATADQVLRSRRDKKPPTVSTIMDLLDDELGGKKKYLSHAGSSFVALKTNCAKSDSHRQQQTIKVADFNCVSRKLLLM